MHVKTQNKNTAKNYDWIRLQNKFRFPCSIINSQRFSKSTDILQWAKACDHSHFVGSAAWFGGGGGLVIVSEFLTPCCSPASPQFTTFIHFCGFGTSFLVNIGKLAEFWKFSSLIFFFFFFFLRSAFLMSNGRMQPGYQNQILALKRFICRIHPHLFPDFPTLHLCSRCRWLSLLKQAHLSGTSSNAPSFMKPYSVPSQADMPSSPSEHPQHSERRDSGR